MTNNDHKHITEANQVLISLGLPRAQQSERSALCLLALLNLTTSQKMVLGGEPAYWHYTDHGLGAGALSESV